MFDIGEPKPNKRRLLCSTLFQLLNVLVNLYEDDFAFIIVSSIDS